MRSGFVPGASCIAIALLSACSGLAGGRVPALPTAARSVHSEASFAASAQCSGVPVPAGTDRSVQSVLNRNAAGATLCFAPGVYRFANAVNPKKGQRLIAAGSGVILTGAKIVSGFARIGSDYRAPGYLQGGAFSSTNCLIAGSGCNTAQDVFLDGKPLARVASRARLASGAFYEDFRANRIWLRDNPAGHLVEQAYAQAIVSSNNGGITVQGFVIEMAASPAQHGAVEAAYRGNGWSIVKNEIRFNHGAGVTNAPPNESQGGTTIAGNYIHDNGQEGIGAIGSGLAVTNNEIAFNNRVNYDCGWECGGAKFAGGPGTETIGLSAIGNNVHDNNGPGFWCDINSYNVVFKNNRISNNRQTNPVTGYQTGSGIFLEISDRAVVAGNVLTDNGPVANGGPALFYQGGQILLSATPNVTVRNNTVIGPIGLGMLQQARNDSCRFGASLSKNYPDGTPVCPYRYHACPKHGACVDTLIHWVHDDSFFSNRITETARSGNADVAGLDSDLADDRAVFAITNNIAYSFNAYTLQNLTGAYFDWENVTTPKAAWLAADQDKKSTFR
jgi:hypothetical protein